jgi:hypothetical protein
VSRRSVVAAPVGLDRGTLTGRSLFFFAASASAPMTVLAGGIAAAFASGVLGVPAAFLVLTLALGLFSVGYVSLARHLPHAGPLYAHIAQGLGPVRGLAAAARPSTVTWPPTCARGCCSSGARQPCREWTS